MTTRIAALVAFGLLSQSYAQGSILFDLMPPVVNDAPGSIANFYGTLTNTGVMDVFLNGDLANGLPSFITLDDQIFFSNVPPFLAGGESYTGRIFDILIGLDASTGTYTSSFTIQGGIDASAFADLATQDFQITVTSAPESASISGVGFGLFFIVLRYFLSDLRIMRDRFTTTVHH